MNEITTLQDRDRRLLAQLAIPINVPEITHHLRIDPHSETLPEGEVMDGLTKFQESGLVVSLGTANNPGALAASLGKKRKGKNAVQPRVMPDEQAQIYETRMAQDRHAWRLEGDLWVISEAGIDLLKRPLPDEPPPLTPSQLQDVVDQEWQRTLTESQNGDTALANALLLEEFQEWLEAVSAECERIWGEGTAPNPPMAGGAGWSDVVENRILDWENQKTAMPALVAPWFMGLTILAFTDTDTPTTAEDGSHKPTYTGYARKSVAAADMNAASAGSASNANAITFAACTAGSSAILGFGNFEASGTTGDFRKYGTCTSTTVSTTQTPPTFAAAAYTTTAD